MMNNIIESGTFSHNILLKMLTRQVNILYCWCANRSLELGNYTGPAAISIF